MNGHERRGGERSDGSAHAGACPQYGVDPVTRRFSCQPQ